VSQRTGSTPDPTTQPDSRVNRRRRASKSPQMRSGSRKSAAQLRALESPARNQVRAQLRRLSRAI